jgi:hypothetical protein
MPGVVGGERAGEEDHGAHFEDHREGDRGADPNSLPADKPVP